MFIEGTTSSEVSNQQPPMGCRQGRVGLGDGGHGWLQQAIRKVAEQLASKTRLSRIEKTGLWVAQSEA